MDSKFDNSEERLVISTMRSLLAASIVAISTTPLFAADPWADVVVSYTAGAGISNDFVSGAPFNNPAVALGEPTRLTSPDSFGGAVTPLQPPFRASEVVSIGYGGSLVIKFNEPVDDDPVNPFGIDFLVFGNSLFTGNYFNSDFSFNPVGTIAGTDAEGGLVEVSADGFNYLPVAGAADGLFPTRAYSDQTEPFPALVGAVPSDFTAPVNPTFNPVGKTYAEILTAYGASGGGAGFDIHATGLPSISYVRIRNTNTSGAIPEIDALADVKAAPEPLAMGLAATGAICLAILRRTVS